MSSKLGFFSNPSTPRLQSQPVSSPSLRCRTTTTTSSVPNSPKLHCRTISPKKPTTNIPRLFNLSNPSSPRSPSSFSFLKASLRLSKVSVVLAWDPVGLGENEASRALAYWDGKSISFWHDRWIDLGGTLGHLFPTNTTLLEDESTRLRCKN